MKNCSGWIIDHQQACVKYTGTMRAVSISRKLTLYVDILQIETSLLKDVDIICQHIALLRPCLNNYLIYWSLPWCCTRAMKLVHLPGGELIKYKYFWITDLRHKNLKYSFSGSGLADDVLNIRGSNTTCTYYNVVPYVEKSPWTGCSRWILSSQRDRRQGFSQHLRKLNNLPDLINRRLNSLKKTNHMLAFPTKCLKNTQNNMPMEFRGRKKVNW